ncbi:phosphate--AMP phosphotransferase [Acinetobacter junii]|uniref:Phosphate--AMP phosphotransferase n=1 Tax=Acinetobacter junii TaxID=40215 RepID=A0AAW5RCF4_ACIJU|nr:MULTISPECIES: phosphate--AMP phosphotransferase [Acinetobacter]APU49825.1 phosphate--AMP phosphotransferase [Acinetobacter junii]AWA49045.1 phosphate--AMP phosphotransferase [Acinetobacter junii]MCU4396558.1 phosphate--AMP phosphotransferase [Acinetobacter junii]MCU4407659.1 phosphate--AMP phosphotransferase [Acinetobacter junii]MDA3500908.1 phosphate--AMP phosphotransferase [Acinetobacter sp. AOR34_HL]
MSTQQPTFELRSEEELSLDLIEAQYALKDSQDKKNAKSVLILVSGIELAGKGEAVKQLREWLDPRYLKVKADAPKLLSADETFWQSYTRFIPAEGQIVVMFGNWYSDLLSTAMHVAKPLDETLFDAYVEQMRSFEHDLQNNNVHVIKVWFDLSWKSLQKRLDQIDASERHWHKLHGLDWRNKKQYDTLQSLSQRFTDDWYVIDGEDAERRDQCFAQYILQTLQELPVHQTKVTEKWQQAKIPNELLEPSKQVLDKDQYKDELSKLTKKVADALRYDDRKVIVALEGMDAAGKGGAIKRIVKKLDPREYEIHTIGAPERYELRRPYLWRFWNKLNDGEKITIFDRTWYGRVLVERIEEYATTVEWQRAYDEINRFEQSLVDSQTIVVKIWLAISKDEQAVRFKEREETPHKRFKITPEDWRNREKWDDYLDAAADMFERTNTDYAPWYVIATDDKNTARIEVLKAILKQLKVG